MHVLRRLLLLITVLSSFARAQPLTVAVAANFKPTLEVVAAGFEKATGHKVSIVSASTGALYNQLNYGAPFDVFLSADAQRPLKLEQEGRIVVGSRRLYALGILTFWHPGLPKLKSLTALKQHSTLLAIANPKTAPYGQAAMEVLAALDISTTKVVRGNSIAQTFQFIKSRNAPAGFIAKSQWIDDGSPAFAVDVPAQLYRPIRQELVILKRTAQPKVAQQFVSYLLSPAVQQVVQAHGYGVLP